MGGADGGGAVADAVARHGETLTSRQVSAFLGHASHREVSRSMARRRLDLPDGRTLVGVRPVGRQPGRRGQLLWSTAEVVGSYPPGMGRRADKDNPDIIVRSA